MRMTIRALGAGALLAAAAGGRAIDPPDEPVPAFGIGSSPSVVIPATDAYALSAGVTTWHARLSTGELVLDAVDANRKVAATYRFRTQETTADVDHLP